jgi:hypothetical protein
MHSSARHGKAKRLPTPDLLGSSESFLRSQGLVAIQFLFLFLACLIPHFPPPFIFSFTFPYIPNRQIGTNEGQGDFGVYNAAEGFCT